MIDELFNITEQIGIANYPITISPVWDDREQDSYFHVSTSDQILGVIHRTATDQWEWSEGGLSQYEADAIGNKIDAHYD